MKTPSAYSSKTKTKTTPHQPTKIEKEINIKRVTSPKTTSPPNHDFYDKSMIHNFSLKRGVNRFKSYLKDSMDTLQLPLKYHSGLLKLQSQSHIRKFVNPK